MSIESDARMLIVLASLPGKIMQSLTGTRRSSAATPGSSNSSASSRSWPRWGEPRTLTERNVNRKTEGKKGILAAGPPLPAIQGRWRKLFFIKMLGFADQRNLRGAWIAN